MAITASDRVGIAGMEGERSVSGRAEMGIVEIPPMMGESRVVMVAAEAKGGACGMQYANCRWKLMGIVDCVFGGYDGA